MRITSRIATMLNLCLATVVVQSLAAQRPMIFIELKYGSVKFANPEFLQAESAVGMLAAALLLTAGLELIGHSVWTLISGDWSHSRLLRRMSRFAIHRQRRRYDQLRETLRHSSRDQAQGARTRNAAATILNRYPSPQRLRPTKLGNALTAVEDKIATRYHASMQIVYPRLLSILPGDHRRSLEKGADATAAFARLTVTLVLAAFVLPFCLPALVSTDSDFVTYFALPFVTFLAALGAAKRSYRASVEAAVALGGEQEVSFDLWRMELLRKLAYQVPNTRQEERTAFWALSEELSGALAHPNLPFVHYYGLSDKERPTQVVTIMGDQFSGDQYNVPGQAVNVGPNALVKTDTITLQQIKSEKGDAATLSELAVELAKLRAVLRDEPDSPDRDSAIGALADAEVAATKGDEPTTLKHLARVGKWVVSIAEKIGVGVAIAALKTAFES
jgi:hypothetical protein